VRICIPTEDDAGLAAKVSDHFGSARWFTLVDSETGTARPVANQELGHRPGTCDAAGRVSELGAEVVVCMGMGRRALGSMQRVGIPVYLTESSTVGEAVAELEMDILLPLLDEDACSGGHGLGAHHRHGP
jgi:predicted Fe-Mo cluster-binding NifX family protein